MIVIMLCCSVSFVVGLVVGIEATRVQVLDALRKVNEAPTEAHPASRIELTRTVEQVNRARVAPLVASRLVLTVRLQTPRTL